MNVLQAERDSLKQENGILRETPDSEDKEYTRLKSELAKERGRCIEMKAECEANMLECEARNDETMIENVQRKVEELSEHTERLLELSLIHISEPTRPY